MKEVKEVQRRKGMGIKCTWHGGGEGVVVMMCNQGDGGSRCSVAVLVVIAVVVGF